VSLFKLGAHGYTANNFLAGWSDPEQTLLPGEGCSVMNPTTTPVNLVFHGEVPQGTLVNRLPSGGFLCSSIALQGGALQTRLGFPIQDGDIVALFNPAAGGFQVFGYALQEWLSGEPILNVGQPFWVLRVGLPIDWTRRFEVSEGSGGSYSIAPGAASGPVGQLNFFTFHPDKSLGRVFDSDGATPLGSGFSAQLYGGSEASEDRLAPMGQPATFLSEPAAGYVRAGAVSLPGIASGQLVHVQLRVWETARGVDYESALKAGGKAGKSAMISLNAGGVASANDLGVLPPNVNQFPSFMLLTVPSPPSITAHPQSQTATVGGTVTFTVSATGEPALLYQWRKDGADIFGATGATLKLNNVQPSDAGAYTVVVSNAAGSVTSDTARLTVEVCAPVPSGLVSWYKLATTAEDFLRRNPPSAVAGLTFVPGRVGDGGRFAVGGFIDIPHSPGLANPRWSVMAWVRPDGPGPNEDGFGSALINKLTGPTSASVWLNWDAPAGKFLAGVGDRAGAVSSARAFPPGEFYHVAATHDAVTFTLYVNGVVEAQQAPNTPLVYDPAFPWTIGANPPVYRAGFPRTFNGVIDEVAIYDRALAASEVQAIHAAGGAGLCPPLPECAPTPADLLSWFRAEGNALDSLGENDGSLQNGATFAPGQVGQAFLLDGVDDFVRVPHAPGLSPPASFTWTMWIHPASLANAPVLMSKEAEIVNRVGLQVTSAGALGGYFDSGTYSAVSPPGIIASGRFTHVAFVFDDAADAARLYVDGALAAEGPERRTPRGNTADLTIGKSALIAGHQFSGLLDEVSIFNRALAPAEIAAIHATGSAGMCPPPCPPRPDGLVSAYPMEEVVTDEAGGHQPSATQAVNFVPGQVGKGLSLGAGGFVEIPNSESLALQRFTWSTWVRPDGPGPNNDSFGSVILGKGESGTFAYALWWRAIDGRFLLGCGDIRSEVIISAETFPSGTFYHVAANYDGTAFKLFINGRPQGEFVSSKPLVYRAEIPWTIGATSAAFRGSFPRTWNGVIDEVEIYGRALSEAEIVGLHLRGLSPCTPTAELGLAPIPDVTLGDVTRGEGVSVTIQPGQSPLSSLRLAVTSSNPDLVPPEHVQFDGAGASRRLFIFPAAGRAGTATLTIRVTDAQGRGFSRSFTVTVRAEPPVITRQPENQTVFSGSGVTFRVSALGSPPLSYQWRRNGAPLPGAIDSALTLAAVTTADIGDFDVVVSNAQGPVTSAPARLTVLEPPLITEHPQSQPAPLGASVTLRVMATGTGALTFQWRHNGFNLPGATNPELVIPSVQAADAGTYSVVVSSPFGAASSGEAVITVLVDTLPFASNFADRGVLTDRSGAGQGNNLLATKEPGESNHAGQPGGHSVWISWLAPENGAVTFDTRGSSFDTLLAVYLGDRLDNLQPVASDDRGGGFDWSTVSFNATAGSTYHLVVDSFREPGVIVLNWTPVPTPVLQVTRAPQSQTVTEGANVAFSVEVFNPLAATTTLTYQWSRNGVPIAGATGATLPLNNITLDQTGLYSVEVNNGVAPAVSVSAELQINQPLGGQADRTVFVTDRLGEAVDLATQVQPQRFRLALDQLAALHGAAPARGYSGAQAFNSFGSSTEVGEPGFCGVLGGASRWFTYTAPASGTLTVSTDGSDFNTVLGVFTGPGLDFETLVLATCDNDGGADGKDSLARLEVTQGTTYFVAVDGVGGVTGTVKLSYTLAVPHRLGPVQANGDDFRITLRGPPGASTTVEASPNLRHWVPLLTTNSLTGLIEFVEHGRAHERRFYRAVQGL
jgi:hypothetical protein